MSTTIDFLKNHESSSPSYFEENAKWRKENKAWLEWSRNIALSLVEYMESNGLNRNGLAERLNVSPQYISKILSGKVNFSFCLTKKELDITSAPSNFPKFTEEG